MYARNPGFLRAALSSGFDPDYIPFPDTNESLLFDAVRHHAEDAVGILLDAQANVDHADATGWTPIRVANSVSYYRMVSLLLSRGADPTAPDKSGTTLISSLKDRGDNGIPANQKEYFKGVVAELERRGLLTQQDIIDATTRRKERKRTGRSTTVIHPRDSAAGRAIEAMDKSAPEANGP